MERERIASRRHPKMTPTDKRKALGIQTGFRGPRHRCSVARQDVPAQMPNAKKSQGIEAASADAYGIVAWPLRSESIAGQRFRRKLRCPLYPRINARFGAWRRSNRDRSFRDAGQGAGRKRHHSDASLNNLSRP
jgi:hypothetical protein